MSANQRMKVANEKAMKNITQRGNVPKGTKAEQDKYPIGMELGTSTFLMALTNPCAQVRGYLGFSSSLSAVLRYSRSFKAYEWLKR